MSELEGQLSKKQTDSATTAPFPEPGPTSESTRTVWQQLTCTACGEGPHPVLADPGDPATWICAKGHGLPGNQRTRKYDRPPTETDISSDPAYQQFSAVDVARRQAVRLERQCKGLEEYLANTGLSYPNRMAAYRELNALTSHQLGCLEFVASAAKDDPPRDQLPSYRDLSDEQLRELIAADLSAFGVSDSGGGYRLHPSWVARLSEATLRELAAVATVAGMPSTAAVEMTVAVRRALDPTALAVSEMVAPADRAKKLPLPLPRPQVSTSVPVPAFARGELGEETSPRLVVSNAPKVAAPLREPCERTRRPSDVGDACPSCGLPFNRHGWLPPGEDLDAVRNSTI